LGSFYRELQGALPGINLDFFASLVLEKSEKRLRLQYKMRSCTFSWWDAMAKITFFDLKLTQTKKTHISEVFRLKSEVARSKFAKNQSI
jgi:hypothetical protein